jgi:hypothetical protein
MIYYAHTGGYTELGGIEEFLKKINNSTFGVPKVEKFEIRISKFETNPNFLMLK